MSQDPFLDPACTPMDRAFPSPEGTLEDLTKATVKAAMLFALLHNKLTA